LAKNDEGFIDLLENGEPHIQQLCAVRLGTKSTIEESRIERFINIGARNKGLLPIPLKYYGAHTGRWAGADAVNFQNLPSRDKKKKALKNSVMAPDGHVVINCDSSQIEARVLAWLAGQDDVVEQFAKGEDVYSIFATKIYKKPISKENPIERFVGKTCILGLGYGTGAAKLRHTLKTQPPGADIPEEQCKRIVDLYRQENDKIPALWRECDSSLQHIMSWPRGLKPYTIGKHGVVQITQSGILLPNKLFIRYPDLRVRDNKYVYKSRKGIVGIWGGAMVENIVQALARIIVGEQMLKIKERYRPVLTVHDAAVIVAPEKELDQATAFITEVMSTPPSWATGLPVACEAKSGQSYGDC
jgi:DNA polymerase